MMLNLWRTLEMESGKRWASQAGWSWQSEIHSHLMLRCSLKRHTVPFQKAEEQKLEGQTIGCLKKRKCNRRKLQGKRSSSLELKTQKMKIWMLISILMKRLRPSLSKLEQKRKLCPLWNSSQKSWRIWYETHSRRNINKWIRPKSLSRWSFSSTNRSRDYFTTWDTDRMETT